MSSLEVQKHSLFKDFVQMLASWRKPKFDFLNFPSLEAFFSYVLVCVWLFCTS